ncbi:MAG: ABC transporter ATP-binding protein [Pseudomonadota bacterium]
MSKSEVQPGNHAPLVEAVGITKVFGSLKANDTVDLTVQAGEIHALLGENGAGKSTLVKILFGSLQPTNGVLRWQGETIRIASPSAARAIGIGMVFQHFSLFDSLTVADNIALGFDAEMSLNAVAETAREVSKNYGLPLDPYAVVGDLSVGERQRIEIVRCLMQNPQLVILDEPTSVLTPQEADKLFEVLFQLRDEGRSVLYISHRLDEVRRLCSAATIMRHGKVVDVCDPRESSPAELAARMVGSDVDDVVRAASLADGAPQLTVEGLSASAATPFSVALKSIDLTVRAGEIVAIAGISGNGQGEFFAALSGETGVTGPVEARTLTMAGVDVQRASITERRRLDVAFVPEERLGHGTVPQMALSENVLLSRHGCPEDGLVSSDPLKRTLTAKLGAFADRISKAMDVRKGSQDPAAASLSGGNLQKFIVGRELDRDPKLIVVNQPTWGVDAGAAAQIRQDLINLAASGAAVLVISQDLDEIFQIASRIAVMSDGHLSSAEPAETMSRERIGLLMAGADDRVLTGVGDGPTERSAA